MHHHHALALLLFSIVFAAFALFTLCTFAPKAHSANIVNNPGKEDISVSALAGLPIRRRSNDVDSYEHLFARDDILITSKGHGTATMSDQGDLDTSRNFPVIQLIQLDTDEKVKHKDTYNPCRQEIRFSDPSLRFEDATTDQSSKSVWDDLLTAVTFLKRDSLHNLSDACLEYLHQEGKPSNIALVEDDSADQDEDDEDDDCSDDEENQRAGTYLMQRRVKRSVSPTGEDLYRNGRLGGVVSTKTTGPRFNSKVNGIPMKHQPSNPQADGGMLQRRDVDNSDILGLSEPLQKKRVMIDFKKAERDAHLANLADGFIIETEYLTPGRKVVQHVNKKPDTRVSCSNVSSFLHSTYPSL